MATADVIQHVVLDELDESILSTVNTAGISLQELAQRLSKYGYPRLHYRIRALERMGLINTGKKGRRIICFSNGS